MTLKNCHAVGNCDGGQAAIVIGSIPSAVFLGQMGAENVSPHLFSRRKDHDAHPRNPLFR